MPKLMRNYYRTSNGEKRVNCYMANLPKSVVEKSNIQEDDEIIIYTKDSKIIIEKDNNLSAKGIIRNEELDKMLEENGKKYTLTMYANRRFNMTQKQLDYVLDYKDDKNG